MDILDSYGVYILYMNIFFDVDYTLIAMDGSLRPGSFETFTKLKNDGHALYVWSGNGIRTREMDKFELTPLIAGVYEKPVSDFDRGLVELGIPVVPDMAVDDYQEIVSYYGGVWVSSYVFYNEADNEMDRVYRIIKTVTDEGSNKEELGYYPPRASR